MTLRYCLRALLVGGALCIAGGLAPTAHAQPGGATTEKTTGDHGRAAERPAWFFDGPRRVKAERLGPPSRDAHGRMLTPVALYYPGRSAPVEAQIDQTALVKLDAGAAGQLAAMGVRLLRPLMPSIGWWLVEDLGGADGLALAERLSASKPRRLGIRQALPNLYLRVTRLDPYVPNDPRFGGQWYFEHLNMTEAWGLELGDASTTIVIVDTGCDLDHPDLVTKMDPGLDVVDGDDDPTYDPSEDGAAHGTSCAGLAAAETDNGEGIAGGCPACRLRCVRKITDRALPISATVDAFEFALQVNADVVSNSWGYVEPTAVPFAIAEAITNLFDNGRSGLGAMVLFAAGNDNRELGDDEIEAVRGVLTIGAINHLEEATPYTNYGDCVDLVAPTGTLTTDIAGPEGSDPGDYASRFGGTSSACPVAAGVAGLLVSAAPGRTSAELSDVMIDTARPAPFAMPDADGHDPVYGYGIVDPVAALRDGLGIQDPEGTPDASNTCTRPSTITDYDSGCAITAGRAPRPAVPVATLLLLALVLVARARQR